jgi:O-antigen/teichoic acid export membrane protein
MLKHITGTFFTRVVVSVVNFAIIIITAQLMGAEARGTISLAMLAIAIAGLINEIIGGPAVVFLVPRYNNHHIIKYAYLWALAVGFLCSFLLGVFHFYDFSLFPYVCAGSLLLCLGAIHQFILLGHQKIGSFNQIALLQGCVLFVVFLGFITFEQKQLEVYFYALLLAYIGAFIVGKIKISTLLSSAMSPLPSIDFKTLFSNGIYTQLASIAHLMSSRITFYYSGYFLSIAFVGVLSTAVSITEAAMLFSSSVALITASKVANETNQRKAADTAIQLIKLSVLMSACILFILGIFPESFMAFVFGKDFKDLKLMILTLIPGGLAGSVSQIISHYYTGRGRFKVNTTAGFISLGFSLAAGVAYVVTKSPLLPGFIISGSAVVAMIYFVRLFLKEQQLKLAALMPNKNDMYALLSKINAQ